MKREGAATAKDLMEYGRHKNDVVQRILRLAGIGADDLATINSAQVPSAAEVPRRWLRTNQDQGRR